MSLYISIPDIPYNAIDRSNAGTFNQFGDKWNALNGERYLCAYQENVGDMIYEFDLGVGRKSAADHLIIARADRLKESGVTSLTLDALNPPSSYSNEFTQASFNAVTLYGSQSQDYIDYSFSSSEYRKWKFTASGASLAKILSKIYFGTAFDMGVDPIFSFEKVFENLPQFETKSGALEFGRLGDPFYRFSFKWEGVSDAKTKEFFSNIVRYKDDQRFFLFTKANHHILNNLRIVHVRLVEADSVNSGNVPDWNDIEAVFEEMIG